MKAIILSFSRGLLVLLWTVTVQANPVDSDHLQAQLIAETEAVQPGETFWVGLQLNPDEGWHTYWKNPGDSGLATRLSWDLPPGSEASDIHWPHPKRLPYGDMVNYGYNDILLPVRITPPQDWQGNNFPLTVEANWLVCQDVCIPGKASLSLTLPVGSPHPNPIHQDAFAATAKRLPAPVDWSAGFSITTDTVTFQVDAPSPVFAAMETLQFFAEIPEIVDNTAEPQIAHTAEQLTVTLPRNPYFVEQPQTLPAVLVVGTGDATLAYHVSANPGLLPTIVPAAPLAAGTTTTTLPMILLLATAGGFILNLMPCVFPVLSLKALALVKKASLERRSQQLHGLAYTAGVLLTFVAVAAVLISLRAGGEMIGWGFQLQSPWFVALMAYLLFVMGLSLSGVVHFGDRLMGVGNHLTEGSGLSSSFFTGVLAVIVASPCTAPFMGTAIGFAVTQTPVVALGIFAALGLGMALPFLLIAFIPALTRWLPRPGPWMDRFKRWMAIPLYLTVLWLLWVLSRQTASAAVLPVLLGMGLLGSAAWLWGRRYQWSARRQPWGIASSITATVCALAILGLPMLEPAISQDSPTDDNIPWEPFSQARLDALRTAGKPVFINMTADWCLSCLANEQVVLSSDAFHDSLTANNVVYLKGDWTNQNPEITALLADFGRSGVPLYVVYPSGSGEPQVLPQFLSLAIVDKAFQGL